MQLGSHREAARSFGVERALAATGRRHTRSSCPSIATLPDGVSTYVLGEAIAEASAPDDVIVSGSSGAGIEIFCLAVTLKEGQRLFLTTALGAMGNGLPGLVGACLANGRRRTICVDGDGGLQLNIQELETARRLQLPIKLFVLNNDGYASIRTSQSRYFGRLAGADATSGVTLPPLRGGGRGVRPALRQRSTPIAVWSTACASCSTRRARSIVEVMTPREEPRAPSLSSMRKPDGSMVSKPLEDLWPFLPRDEFLSNMMIPPVED